MRQAHRVGSSEFHQVWGFTPEQKWDGDTDTYELKWEQHDLGLHPDREAANRASDEWRKSVTGLYE
jgi:hypothetical protein